jgi:anthranilate synthase component 1
MSALTVMSKQKLADTETPVSAYLKACRGRPDSFLFETVETKDVTGRYSIVAWDPIFGIELEADRLVTWNGHGLSEMAPSQFFFAIRDNLKRLKCECGPLLPAVGSLMGFVGYDAVRLIERLPPALPCSLPVARLVLPSRFVVFDHLRRIMVLLAVDSDNTSCAAKIREIEQVLDQPLSFGSRKSAVTVAAPPRERFCRAVEKSQEYIKAGDIFQVVLSDAFEGETGIDPFEVYRRLRVLSPSPYMFYLNFDRCQLIGSSPETLVKVADRLVTVRPIAGTRGRSNDFHRDRELEAEMMSSEKELAEHVMLVDLGRNDVGRVCKYGTVRVEPFMSVERYSHVMHIVSQVRGELREDADAVDAFMAGFPAGTVSGAPKIRAMEIIDELEGVSRGPYGGAVGYFGPDGNLDTCIAIRTVLFEGTRFTIRVGAGIVADSDPQMEYKEIQNKAAQSINALRTAAEGEL